MNFKLLCLVVIFFISGIIFQRFSADNTPLSEFTEKKIQLKNLSENQNDSVSLNKYDEMQNKIVKDKKHELSQLDKLLITAFQGPESSEDDFDKQGETIVNLVQSLPHEKSWSYLKPWFGSAKDGVAEKPEDLINLLHILAETPGLSVYAAETIEEWMSYNPAPDADTPENLDSEELMELFKDPPDSLFIPIVAHEAFLQHNVNDSAKCIEKTIEVIRDQTHILIKKSLLDSHISLFPNHEDEIREKLDLQ